MTISTHTPGPWTISEREGLEPLIREPNGYAVALAVIPCNTAAKHVTDHYKANATLIAAAPELLAEAIELLKNARYADGEGIVLTQDCEALEAVIAKATGQAVQS